ncbi:N-acyl-D-glucosamine 2-epimerase [Raphidocelis subcapitata]|uniref:N-acylglucosamine 2-epimerase n=1 Tax=Raphidocelis subcapitata TaxID=307507 RepID=A0A2V0P1B2_9CHLO|nr:N-acyl-D-glucosamine 2-epimerase [Raphidocelis subcapitata]|eukprot:GBF93359.1 N-acyl-D-glucosamine 2-epimerase [Raphidocelis subcapitata]
MRGLAGLFGQPGGVFVLVCSAAILVAHVVPSKGRSGGAGAAGCAAIIPGAAARAAPPACRRGQLEAISKLAASMRQEVQGFWLDHGPDKEYGGFYGTVERYGRPGTNTTDKSFVQQARHCWAFSCAYSSKLLRGRGAAAAKTAWDFMTKHMLRPDDATWRWIVARDGSATNGSDYTHLYSTFFSLYAATAYSQAFEDESALQLALATFSSMDASHHDDSFGGFDEDASMPKLHDLRLPAGPGGAARLPRTLNVFLHGTEALASLYEASGDEAVLARLLELLRIICEKMVTKDNVLYEYYDPNGWKPFGPPSVNWGHNLESAWIVSTVVDSLVAKRRMPAATADRYASTVMAVAARALREGFDAQNGGVFEAGVPGAAPGVGKGASTEKLWWVQCESMLAMWEVYRRTGDCGALDKLQATLQFVHDHMRDPEDREWVWSTDASGTKLGPNKWQKGNHWKATYHNTRALMFLEDWIGAATP